MSSIKKKKLVANRNSQDALHIIWTVSGNVCQSVCILSRSVNHILTEVLVMMLSATAAAYLGISSASGSWSWTAPRSAGSASRGRPTQFISRETGHGSLGSQQTQAH